MPYHWSQTASDPGFELELWPHNSLEPRGFAVMILGFFLFATIPLYALIGTLVFWGMLPFVLGALAALYYALRRNERDRRIREVLTVSPDITHLARTNADGSQQDWTCNTYWVRVSMHEKGGPVPHYVTLNGSGREVEIGAFLSEDERKALYLDLSDRVADMARAV